MDISNFFGDVEVVEQQTEIKPGRYDLEYVNTNEELRSGQNGWMGMQLNFRIAGTGLQTGFTVTVAHDNPKYVGFGMKEMAGLAKAAGITGTLKDTNELNGKTVSCMLKLNDNNYPEIDSKFGSHWQPAKGVNHESFKQDAAKSVEGGNQWDAVVDKVAEKKEEDLGDKIPF